MMVMGSAQAGTTFDAVKKRGKLVCGVTTGLPGFSAPDEKGNWTGIDVDTCRAVAAAALGDGGRARRDHQTVGPGERHHRPGVDRSRRSCRVVSIGPKTDRPRT